MRVALVHNLRSQGGAWRRVSEQLRAADMDVQEFTLEGAIPVTATPVVVPLAVRATSAHVALRPVLRHVDLLMLAQAYTRLQHLVVQAEPDVVWCNPCSLLQTPPLRHRKAPPVVYYCDEPRRADYDEVARVSTRRSTRALYSGLRQYERRLDRRGVAAANTIVTNSKYTAAGIRAAYGRTADVVRLGVGSQFQPEEVPITHLLSVGTLIPSKGHDLALRALAASQLDLPLVVVSPRDEPAEERRLRDLAQHLGVAVVIKILVSDSELVHLYRGALATMYLAKGEPLGLASLESQACGTPVIVSAEGGLPETIQEGRTGWSTRRDASAVAPHLQFLSEPRQREPMSMAATVHGRAFTWDDSGRLLRQALEHAA